MPPLPPQVLDHVPFAGGRPKEDVRGNIESKSLEGGRAGRSWKIRGASRRRKGGKDGQRRLKGKRNKDEWTTMPKVGLVGFQGVGGGGK